MDFEVLIQSLKNRDKQLCSLEADELENLDRKYQESGRTNYAMSSDCLKPLDENRKLKDELRKQKNDF